ncbi:hypothetical protein [Clostridium estertheticum]|uniref:hypothetical protein n=1 Tax=Clostridium estertheticum TaxID=238834 RepID=UPI001C6E01CC|nr:hypothetical protein [Clostridium estertheticum]MBW9154285.1 hypothetical protein [Clostridium estertheticum]WLC86660.1 hypothetical protein KTC97_22075 [Clostridium estertheticum]
MFDLNTIKKRYFEIKMGEQILELEPPSKKMLTKVTALSNIKDGKKATDGLYEAVEMILNKNSANKKISEDTVADLNLDQVSGIVTAYFEWLKQTKDSKN